MVLSGRTSIKEACDEKVHSVWVVGGGTGVFGRLHDHPQGREQGQSGRGEGLSAEGHGRRCPGRLRPDAVDVHGVQPGKRPLSRGKRGGRERPGRSRGNAADESRLDRPAGRRPVSRGAGRGRERAERQRGNPADAGGSQSGGREMPGGSWGGRQRQGRPGRIGSAEGVGLGPDAGRPVSQAQRRRRRGRNPVGPPDITGFLRRA